MRLLRSKDGGEHWDPPIAVAERTESDAQGTVRFPQVAVGGATAYVMWEEWGEVKGLVKTLADAQNQAAATRSIRSSHHVSLRARRAMNGLRQRS